MKNSDRNIRNVGFFLLGIFALFFIVGFYNAPITVEIKKASLPKVKTELNSEKKTTKLLPKKDTNSAKVPAQLKMGGSERILLVGDSQLEAMRTPFYNYVVANKHELLATVLWYGSSSKQWANTDTLNYYIRKYKPTMVVLVLGLNELFVNDLDARKENMSKIKNQLNQLGLNHYWIGPAAWKKDRGVIDVMQREWADRFYASQKLKLGRAKDNRHPSNAAAWIWMQEVAKETTKKGILNLKNPVRDKTSPKKSPFILLTVPK